MDPRSFMLYSAIFRLLALLITPLLSWAAVFLASSVTLLNAF